MNKFVKFLGTHPEWLKVNYPHTYQVILLEAELEIKQLKEKIYNVLFGIAKEDLTHAEKQILELVNPK